MTKSIFKFTRRLRPTSAATPTAWPPRRGPPLPQRTTCQSAVRKYISRNFLLNSHFAHKKINCVNLIFFCRSSHPDPVRHLPPHRFLRGRHSQHGGGGGQQQGVPGIFLYFNRNPGFPYKKGKYFFFSFSSGTSWMPSTAEFGSDNLTVME